MSEEDHLRGRTDVEQGERSARAWRQDVAQPGESLRARRVGHRQRRGDAIANRRRESCPLGIDEHALVLAEIAREAAYRGDLARGIVRAAPHEDVRQYPPDHVEAGIPEQLALEHPAQAEAVATRDVHGR